MKPEAREQARELRRTGASIKAIAKQIGVSQGSVSVWVRDVPVADDLRAVLVRRAAGNARLASEGRKRKRVERYAKYWADAEAEWSQRSANPKFMFGLALYIGEGSKTDRNVASVSNCDARVIRSVIDFFEQVGAPRTGLIVRIHIHDVNAASAANEFWVTETGLTEAQFRRPTVAVSGASHQTKGNIQPFGTCHVNANSTEVRQKIEKWMALALGGPPPQVTRP